MNIDLAVTWTEAQHVDLTGRAVVVIDVLRATSTIVAAFHSGARAVIPVDTVEAARAMASRLERGSAVLGGEREGLQIDGFQLGNSPLDYTPEAVAGKTVILTTTNGTRALLAARKADHVVAASLANVSAAAERLHNRDQDVTVICAGTEGRLSLDDLHCGGMLISRLLEPGVVRELSDGARAATEWFVSNAGNAEHVLRSCFHGQRLAALGFAQDIAFCFQIDTTAVVPVWNGHALVLDEVPRAPASAQEATGEGADRV